MALNVTRVDVWAASIEDRPGGLAEKLAALAEAGAQLEFVISRRAPDKPGTGVVFLTPLKGAAQIGAAKKAGFEKTETLHSLRIDGPDQPGLGAKMTQLLAQAGINLRGLSAAAIGKRCMMYLALDSSADATKAARLLKRL
ncbi:MAG: ACT domain-containing protein [Pirellulales bacterium]|nr:ACT domain-containing protein [Pirellulales bacterium]